MNLRIYFKGENGKVTPSDSYDFEEAEAEKLLNDFQVSLKLIPGSSTKGGTYKCQTKAHSATYQKYLSLRFNEVIYIG